MILSWDKPKKVTTGKNLPKYASNMSVNDMFKWKAKYIGGENERVEIKKTFSKMNKQLNRCIGAQCSIIVSKNSIDGYNKCNILISMNGKSGLSFNEYEELKEAIEEAKQKLK